MKRILVTSFPAVLYAVAWILLLVRVVRRGKVDVMPAIMLNLFLTLGFGGVLVVCWFLWMASGLST